MPDPIIPAHAAGSGDKVISRAEFRDRYLFEHDLPGRYWEASEDEKGRILDAAVAATNYHRKSLIRLFGDMRRGVQRRSGSGRPPIYSQDARSVVADLWDEMGHPSERKLKGSVRPWAEAMVRHGELEVSGEVLDELSRMSASTMRRAILTLRPARKRQPKRARPQSEVQAATPLRTWPEWRDATPGEVQIDTVFHAGGQGGGGHLYSVTVIEPFSGWIAARAIASLSATNVVRAIDDLRRKSPAPWVSIHTDNGAEFMNRSLRRWAGAHDIEHTRGRPGKSNDQAHIEHANQRFVRALVGDHRYEGAKALEVIDAIYDVGADLENFFMANVRMIEKVPSKTGRRAPTRRYDKAQTAFVRLCRSGAIETHTLRGLEARFTSLNPVALSGEHERLLDRLWGLARYSR
jgi:transposase InsO family protein